MSTETTTDPIEPETTGESAPEISDEQFMAEMETLLINGGGQQAEAKESDVTIESTQKTEEAENSDQEDTSIDKDDKGDEPETVDNHDNQADKEDSENKDLTAETTEAEKFYNTIAGSKIMVDGVEMAPETDPEKILKMQEELYSLKRKEPNTKVDSITRALEEHGLLDGNSLGLLIEAKNGNVNAIKKLLKDSDIDPLSLVSEEGDGEEVDIDTSKYYETKEDIQFYDFISKADTSGVLDVVKKELVETWDTESIEGVISNPNISANILEHAKNGVIHQVKDEIVRQELQTPGFKQKNNLEKYIAANNIIADRINAERANQVNTDSGQDFVDAPNVETTDETKASDEEARLANAEKLANEAKDTSTTTADSKTELTDEEFMNSFVEMFNN